MAKPTLTGIERGFDADGFRSIIKDVMTMGLPQESSERATFRKKTAADYTVESPAGNPYDWTASPTAEVVYSEIQVPVAVEFVSNRTEGGAPIGEFDNPRVVITVLDEEYEQVKTYDEVLLGGNTYSIRFWGPPVGLFDVTVYQCYLNAVDEA